MNDDPPIIEITHASQYDLVPAKGHPLRGVQTDPRVAPRDQYALLLPGVVEVDVGVRWVGRGGGGQEERREGHPAASLQCRTPIQRGGRGRGGELRRRLDVIEVDVAVVDVIIYRRRREQTRRRG